MGANRGVRLKNYRGVKDEGEKYGPRVLIGSCEGVRKMGER